MTTSKNKTDTTSNETKEHNCGHNLVDWDGDGNCITCARDKIADPLGDMFEAMGVDVIDVTPKEQSDE